MVLHPTVPVLGVADKVAVMAPPNIRLADGIVHVPSAIVKDVAVPALPSVGGAFWAWSMVGLQRRDPVKKLTVFGAIQV